MKIAILGFGSIGRRHAANLRSMNGIDVLAYDPDEGVAAGDGCDCVHELSVIWKFEPEVVFVTAPTQRHLELALEAARRHCHLFIEKPLYHTLEGLDALIAIAAANRILTMVGCNMRFHRGLKHVREYVRNDAVGTIRHQRLYTGSYLPAWRPGSDYHRSYSASPIWGGAILDCIHEIDLALWLGGAGDVLAAVSIPATGLDLTTDGLAEILVHHHNGVISSIHLNFIQRDYSRFCRIIGDRGTIYWDFTRNTVSLGDTSGNLKETRGLGPPAEALDEMYVAEIAHFLEAIRQHAQPMNSITEARQTLAVALQARASRQRWDASADAS